MNLFVKGNSAQKLEDLGDNVFSYTYTVEEGDTNGEDIAFKEYARHFNIPSLFCKVAYFKDELPIEAVRRIKSLYNSYIEDLNVKGVWLYETYWNKCV